MQLENVDVLIIGAGPAGLAAASACLHNNVSYRICEVGEHLAQRDRADPKSLVQGTGGAGLFSDGKFSFFPSATRLWTLEDIAVLRRSYDWFDAFVSPHGLNVPRFQDGVPMAASFLGHSPLKQKRYSCQYLPLEVRTRIIGLLEQEHEPCLMNGTSVKLLPNADSEEVICELARNGRVEIARPRKGIVLATGRHGPMAYCSTEDSLPILFRQVELGVRIEQKSEEFFLRDQQDLDPKLLLQLTSLAECRTFCCCREGEIVATETPAGVVSFSGRADVGRTGMSNVGFNLRTTDEVLGAQIWREFQNIKQPVEAGETEWLQGREILEGNTMKSVAGWVGPTAASMLHRGLEVLIHTYENLETAHVRLLGPCVECVGWYPAVDRSLRVPPYGLWVAGDATGIFRGLTASFVSGYYAGLCASRQSPVGSGNNL